MPFIIPEDGDVPANVHVVLIVCTNGCFHSTQFVRKVLTADETGVHFIPVVAVEHFRFPVCGQITEEMREVALGQHTLEDFVRVLDTIFREIAIGVILQDSEDALAVRMAALASRVSDACERPRRARHHRVHSNAVPMETRHHEVPDDGAVAESDVFIGEDELQSESVLSLEDVDVHIYMTPDEPVPWTYDW